MGYIKDVLDIAFDILDTGSDEALKKRILNWFAHVVRASGTVYEFDRMEASTQTIEGHKRYLLHLYRGEEFIGYFEVKPSKDGEEEWLQ